MTYELFYCYLWTILLLPLDYFIVTYGLFYCYLWTILLLPLNYFFVTLGLFYCYLWTILLLPQTILFLPLNNFCYLWTISLLPLKYFIVTSELFYCYPQTILLLPLNNFFVTSELFHCYLWTILLLPLDWDRCLQAVQAGRESKQKCGISDFDPGTATIASQEDFCLRPYEKSFERVITSHTYVFTWVSWSKQVRLYLSELVEAGTSLPEWAWCSWRVFTWVSWSKRAGLSSAGVSRKCL